MKMLAKPVYFELVIKESNALGYNLNDLFIDIAAHNTFSYNTFLAYYNDIKLNKKKSLQDLI